MSWNTSVTLCAGSTNAVGNVTCTVTIPGAPAGPHDLTLGVGSNQLTLLFAIRPAVQLSQPIGSIVGALVNLTGSGFDAGRAYTAQWNSTVTLCANVTGADGSFNCPFRVPLAPGGVHTINVTEQGWRESVSFTILPHTALSPLVGEPGTQVTVTATGLNAGRAVVVAWNSTRTLCNGSSDANGAFSCLFIVPSYLPGTYAVTVSDGIHTPVGLFTINATAPPPPPASSPPFPWWAVAVAALAVVGILGGALLYSRRRPGRRPAPVAVDSGPSAGEAAPVVPEYIEGPPTPPTPVEMPGASSMPAVSAIAPEVPPPAPAVAPAAPPTGPAPDIDRLIEQLDKIASEILKRPTPTEEKEHEEGEAEVEPDAEPEKDADA